MKFQLRSIVLVIAAALAVVMDGPVQAKSYPVLDRPSLPCNLFVEAVATWGETAAHLPQACTYDE